MKIACVAVVKDEERYIAEWIAYQLALGFDTVVLLDNGSADQTKAIAARFAPRYDVRVLDWPIRTPDYLIQAYAHAAREFAVEFAWLGYLDTDEFLVLDDGVSLKPRLEALPDAAAVAVPWAMFGSSGHRESPAGLVIENYQHRGPADFDPNRHVKSIIRPELMKTSLNGHAFEMDGPYVDLAGREVAWEFPACLAAAPDYAGGKVNHYFTRSWDDWLAKLRRGYHDRKRPEDEFYVYDRNDVFDDTAAKLAPQVKAIISSLTAVEKNPPEPLVICPKIHGGTTLIGPDPECRTYRNVLHMPFRHEMPSVNRSHGIYDLEGRLITAAGRFFGPDSARVHHAPMLFTAQNMGEVKDRYDEPLFYLGRFTNHYGHFLVDTLCRMWAFKSVRQKNMKILYHGDHGAESFFEMEFAAAIFRSMGLAQADFIKFDEPTILGDIVIASPCFEELNFVHKAFAEFFNQVGASIAGAGAVRADDNPVYLTKMNVKSGISHFVNEADFVNVLAKAGVEIIAPETLSFPDQIDIFRNKKIITGLIGSAFHTSIFVPARKMLVLNYEDTVWSNQLLMDRANGNDVTYVYEGRNSENLGNDGKFLNNFVMADPKHLAERFLREIDRFSRSAGRSSSAASTAATEKRHKFSIVACARWETPYIVEWLNYYRALGFDHVYLYCNDDDPVALYEAVLPFTQGPAPFVTFRYYPHQGQQLQMYADFLKFNLDDSEWISFFDVDEFLRLPPGQTISTFMSRFDDSVDCVLFNWIFFGPNGHKTAPSGHVLSNFTQRQRSIHPFTKFVARSSICTGPKLFEHETGHGFWHSLHDKVDKLFRVVNVLGENMRSYYDGFPAVPADYVNHADRKERILETAIIHHYAFRSEQAFWERSDRGLLGAFDGQSMWRRLAEGPEFGNYLATVNAETDLRLAGFWSDLSKRAWGLDVLARPSGKLISKGKPALQSSVSEWSRRATRQEDAAGAVNGQRDGRRKFHTALEDDPWWQVDLGGFATIREIHIYNTTDHTARRFRNFSLSVSIEGEFWIEIARKEDDEVVGGVTGGPYVWNGPGTAWARFVRITLLGHDHLHLDQVEVFGEMPA